MSTPLFRDDPHLSAMYEGMSETEKLALSEILAEYVIHGTSSTYNSLQAVDWRFKLPSIAEMLEDPYFFGSCGQGLFPLLKQQLIDILTRPYLEVILEGSLGWGKSMLAGYAMAIDMVRLACLRKPQQVLGIASNTALVFTNLSTTGSNAENVVGGYVIGALKSCPFAKEYLLRWEPDLGDSEIHFACATCRGNEWIGGRRCPDCYGTGSSFIRYQVGNSSEMSVIGENIVGGVMDEANFLVGAKRSRRAILAGETDMARTLYDALVNRRQSRFIDALTKHLVVLPRFFVVSSAQFPGDFTEQRVEASKNNPFVKHLRYAQWVPRMSLPRHPYSGKTFPVLVGNSLTASRVLSWDHEFDDLSVNLPEGCRIVRIPIEYREPFELDVIKALRDIAGISIAATNPFFTEPLTACYCNKDVGDVPRVHPYEFVETKVLSAALMHSHLIPTRSSSKKDRGIQPYLNPNQLRFVHFDLATTSTTAGMAVGHFGGYKRYRRDILGKTKVWTIHEDRPIVIYDFFLRILPPDLGRIDLDAARAIVYALQHACGMDLGFVGYDRFESSQSINIWQSQGIKSELFSVERHPEAWSYLRDAIRDRRVSCYPYVPLEQDLERISWDGSVGAIVKPEYYLPNGTKSHCEIAECGAAIAWHIHEKFGVRLGPVPDAFWSSASDWHVDPGSIDLFTRAVAEGHITPEEARRQVELLDTQARTGLGDPWSDIKPGLQ